MGIRRDGFITIGVFVGHRMFDGGNRGGLNRLRVQSRAFVFVE